MNSHDAAVVAECDTGSAVPCAIPVNACIHIKAGALLPHTNTEATMHRTQHTRPRLSMPAAFPGMLLAALLVCAAPGASANGDASAPSRASADMSAQVIGGSVMLVAVGGSAVVAGVYASAEGVDLVLRGAGQASTATVRLSGEAARGLSIAAGTVLEVVATSTGHVLVLSGKALAFVPNEIGKALLHHERVAA
jgi:hypothetical protein